MRQTRTASKSDADPSSDDSVEVNVSLKGPPSSDRSYERKFVIARANGLTNSSLYRVCHPKNGSPCLYRISEKTLRRGKVSCRSFRFQ
ncbi:hypothetical protein KIN20_000012 [Parelaphostrongylus tenuis]|uniref:Uncharacterized protein n=1 Tax=Parelaphostrongylus tenuis TaxID=148309 RepID=A0AAD5MCM9_PARTN|nr:hypothetical protein KIN20_000012 [Parelaphostrongylus tenuis]